MDKTKKNLICIVVLLVILLLISVGVICYMLGSNSNENQTDIDQNIVENQDEKITPVSYQPKCVDSSNSQQTLLTDIDETKYSNITEYINEQKNVSVKITYCSSIDPENGPISLEYVFTDVEKKNMLEELKSSSMKISPAGLGGVCVPALTINYQRNGSEYFVYYYSFFAMSSNDGNIYKIIDKNITNNLEESNSCIYEINTLGNTVDTIKKKFDL